MKIILICKTCDNTEILTVRENHYFREAKKFDIYQRNDTEVEIHCKDCKQINKLLV